MPGSIAGAAAVRADKADTAAAAAAEPAVIAIRNGVMRHHTSNGYSLTVPSSSPFPPYRGLGLKSSSSTFHLSASTAGQSPVSLPATELRLLCLDLQYLSPSSRFLLLSTGIFVFFMLNSYLEEYIFHVLPSFTFGWFLTLLELTLFALFAVVERVVKQPAQSPLQHVAPLSVHLGVALAMTASRGLTNVSLQFLNYPTQIIFKSMKLLSVMAGSLCILSQTFHPAEYASALCLVVSAVLFSYGDYTASADETETVSVLPLEPASASSSPSPASLAASLHVGVVVVLVSLVADAFHATSQDSLMRAHDASTLETMLFTNLFSSLLSLLVVLLTGELQPAVAYCLLHPISLPLLVLRAAIIYAGVLCFLLLLKAHGAVTATAVTTVRKILSIIVSFLLFPKPWTNVYLAGLAAFGAGLGLSVWSSGRERQEVEGRQGKDRELQPQSEGESQDEAELQLLVADSPKSAEFSAPDPSNADVAQAGGGRQLLRSV